ncbi:MAG: chromosome segregation protein SMC [Candidatus Baltobacteraceae bacterium]
MQLKKIKTFGFKTFAEPTTLEFGGGITAIVGPNGSGKSNLIDAFRWVLGEQSSKSLRSGKMEDVIFIGNDQRKPLGLAEVSITFDNSDRKLPIDFAEVEITRRAYRVGEIEYYINRNQCRLRDIMDLLMGTGLGPGSYSIVSQGQIDQILTSKPADRRALFEETAGINKFLARKNESLRRLEQTEQNAIRINDLISELERRIPELDTQVRRAKRYRKLSARVRDIEILSYLRAGASRRAEREALKAELERNEEARGNAAAQAALLGANLAQARTNAYQQELEVEEERTRGQELRAKLARLEADYAAALARRGALEAQSTQTSQDADRVAREREALRTAIAGLQAKIEPLQAQLESARADELAAQTALAQARGELDAIFTKLRQVEAAASERAARKAERRVQRENARSEAGRLEEASASARAHAEQLEIAAGAAAHRFTEREAQLAQLESRFADAGTRAEEAERSAAAAQTGLAHAQTAHGEYSSAVAAAQSRLHTIEELENSLEGHVPGTRAVVEAWQRNELRGIEGIVSNLITTEEPYARAMDVAFGARLSNIITATSEDAERAIEYLNTKELGRATFLPLDTLQNRTGKELSAELRAARGVLGYAHTLIRTQPQYESIVRFLVGSVLVVDTLQTGIDLVRGRGLRDTIVTLSGEQIAGGGAITGGRYQRERSILSRRVQAQTLREQLAQMREQLAQLEDDVRVSARAFEDAGSQRDAARAALARAEVELTEVRGEMAGAAAEAERIQREYETARTNASESHAQAQAARERERAFDDGLPEDGRGDEQRARLEDDLARAREHIGSAEAFQAQASSRAADLREQAAALGAERDGARARLGIIDLDTERAAAAREAMAQEIASLTAQTAQSSRTLHELREQVRECDAQFEAARKRREALADDVTKLEADLRSAEIAEREAQTGGERHRTRLAEIEAELGMLVSQFAQNPASEDECREVEERYRTEPDALADDLPRLREELARLSNVNLNAEADREELAQREQFLREQLDDLSKARETLLQSIREIEQQSQTKFNETFDQVCAAFTQMYGRLFPGGTAKMWQTNPENLSETGIEISVQPPGKKLMPLPTLSGGERAMTAAALIFALIKVRPSPFYLLDEVDAALDDANIERFSSMVREMAGNSQMVIVTHNKQTMELADRMYGVTMGEAGVSTIISAELTQREREPEPAIA